MCTKRCLDSQRGMTLIELVVFIVVVSVGLAGVLSVFNVVVKGSADPLVTKQALAVADSLLEEILLKDFCDPSSVIEVTADTAIGSANLTAVSPATTGITAGWRVLGAGIPAGAKVKVGGVGPTTVELVDATGVAVLATVGASGVTAKFLPCAVDRELNRIDYDDVLDYHNTSWQPASDVAGGTIFSPPSLYRTKVEVSAPTLAGSAGTDVATGDVLEVVVTVLAPDTQEYVVTGYRYFYD